MATLLTPSATLELPVGVAAAEACVSCGTPLAGEYCHACGERRVPEELALRRAVREFAEDVFDVDSRVLRWQLRSGPECSACRRAAAPSPARQGSPPLPSRER